MDKNKMFMAEIAMTLYAFNKSIILGIGFLSYIVITRNTIDSLKNQLSITIDEEIEPTRFEEKNSMIKKMYQYKKHTIEDYGDGFMILKPDGARVQELYSRIEDARYDIDIICKK